MTPRLSHLWLSAAALASLSQTALACPPKNQSQNTSASQADIPPDNIRSKSAATDSVRSDRVSGDHVRSTHNKFRSMVLEQFDANHNGKLDSKERAAANRGLSSKGGGPALESLRQQALAEFDSNHNGKLEKTEIHKALNTVNPSQTSRVATNTKSPSTQSQRIASAQLQQQLLYSGNTTTSSQIQALESLLANNSGTLTSAETAAIQALLAQLLAQVASSGSTTGFVPLTATTGTGTTGTGTTTASTTGSGMCSGSGSSTGSSSSTGSTGSSGTSTTSAARNSTAQASNGSFLSAGGPGAFGGPGGGGPRGGRGH
jgi:hypothetical protein